MAYTTFKKIVKTAGTAEQISSVSLPFTMARIRALSDNSGDVYLAGAPGVPTSNSYILSFTASTLPEEIDLVDDNLQVLWLNADNDDDGAVIFAQVRDDPNPSKAKKG